jgi:SAM-dependent methyltransferase
MNKMLQEVARGSRILDIGCGEGTLASDLIGLGYQVVGLDFSPIAIQKARKYCPAGEFIQINLDEEALSGYREYSMAIFMMSIAFLSRPRGILEELRGSVQKIAIVTPVIEKNSSFFCNKDIALERDVFEQTLEDVFGSYDILHEEIQKWGKVVTYYIDTCRCRPCPIKGREVI